jgi:hypothetical protein
VNINVEFQMVCGNCGSLTIKIEHPEGASRETVVYCGHCGASRGTMGALRDLADRPNPHAVPLGDRLPMLLRPRPLERPYGLTHLPGPEC